MGELKLNSSWSHSQSLRLMEFPVHHILPFGRKKGIIQIYKHQVNFKKTIDQYELKALRHSK